VTEVLRGIAQKSLLGFICAVLAGAALGQQEQLPASTNVRIQAQSNQRAAEELYLQLRSVGLDAARVYQVREASLDRNQLHISLDDGTIAFTQDVKGRVTGALERPSWKSDLKLPTFALMTAPSANSSPLCVLPWKGRTSRQNGTKPRTIWRNGMRCACL